ncbi:MAG TPA: hypothetical protein VHW24_02040 [Bryobacteraceae bacterium]|jgi:predicted phage tail protein|nr:hypothetical protein [Bryobacteraceae bacterium]
MLDLRLPIGWFFAITGILLLAMALFSPASRAPLTDANVNLYCGAFMTIFGVLMLLLAIRRPRRRV